MIVVIADDLSGAAELAGVALRHGLSAEVQTAFTAGTDASVICVDTDTRLLPPAEAIRVAETVARKVVAARPAWIFKKCDSVLRGPVLAEARAMARVAGKVRIVILPANPSRGRVIRAGNYFVEGRPLHETVFAHDPTHPRTTSRVAELLGDDLADVATPNAETMADMALCAAEVGDDTLPVGAADFFKALLARRTPPRVQATRAQQDCAPTFHAAGARAIPRSVLRIPPSPSVLVCGSAASWAQRVEAATAQGIPIFALPHDVAAAVAALRASHRLLMGIGHGSATHGRSPAELVGQLAVSVAAILHEARPARLLLEGGATTAAVMRALGWTRLRACEVSAQCVGVLRPADPAGPLLFIKPGSYPWPAEIWPG